MEGRSYKNRIIRDNVVSFMVEIHERMMRPREVLSLKCTTASSMTLQGSAV